MGKIDSWITKLPRLKNSKVARFSYRAEAYANDEIEGVSSYDYAQDMNVPLATHTDFDASMLSIGARANLSSVPKNGLNHFFGRVSYNLNKVIDFLSDFLDDFRVQGVETVASSVSITLSSYYSGKKLRLANTHATNTITCTLPTGQTMNGQSSFTIAPDTLLEFELIGTVWKCVSNKSELLWENSSPSSAQTAFTSTLSGFIRQFSYLEVVFRLSSNISWLISTGRIPIISGMVINLNSTSNGYIQRRYTTGISGVSIQWSTGEALSGYNSGLYVETTSCIPVRIYGIK